MKASDPEEIFLQPECCASPDVGRLWCEDDEPVTCEDGVPWTRYVRADREDPGTLNATGTCGLFHCPLEEARDLMPDLPWDTAPVRDGVKYVVDVKVHMLMPGQWPCIPNWHNDFVPRDENKVLQPHLIDPSHVMLLWLSGPPLTEFRDGRTVQPREWVEFTQEDEHRGTVSMVHQWRTFIRLTPSALLEPAPPERWIRRHTQVYLDAEEFTW